MENTTAKVSLFARGYHYENNTVHVFADTAAKKLLGQEYDQIAQSMSQGINFFIPGFNGTADEGLRLIVDNQLSPSVLGRSAFCENMIENEVKTGCTQIAILALGYHKGSYANIGEAHAFLMKYADQNGYTVAGLARECYIEGIWNKESEEEWLTEIQLPIEDVTK